MHKLGLKFLLSSSLLLSGLIAIVPISAASSNYGNLVITGSDSATLQTITSGNQASWSNSQSALASPIDVYWTQGSGTITIGFQIKSAPCSSGGALCLHNSEGAAAPNNEMSYTLSFKGCGTQAWGPVTCQDNYCTTMTTNGDQSDCSGPLGSGFLAIKRNGLTAIPNAGTYTTSVNITANSPNFAGTYNHLVTFTETVASNEGVYFSTDDIQFPTFNLATGTTPQSTIRGYFYSNSATTSGLYIHVSSTQIGSLEGVPLPYLSYTDTEGKINKLYYTINYNTPCGGGYDQTLTATNNYRGSNIGFETPIPATNTFNCNSGSFLFSVMTPK